MSLKFPQRRIGDDLVSSLGLGCMGMAIVLSSGPYDEEESLKVLTQAADMESTSGDEIFLATKFGITIADSQMKIHGEPGYVKNACEASLKRLQTDRIDLYYRHRVDPVTPIEKTVEAMAQLKNEGKIRYLGLSECSAQTLRRAHKVHPIAAAEMEFSPFALDIESPKTNFLKTARELGVKIVPYSPLGRGFLTGTVKSRDDFDARDMRRVHPRFSEENFGANLKIVHAIAATAKEKGCAPGQLTLAWVLAQGDDFIPIPGTKHVKYLKENAGAVGVNFSKEDDERIRKAIESVGGSRGARYPEMYLSQCFADSPELGTV